MSKQIKVGVHKGAGDPPFRWRVLILDVAFRDAMKFLDHDQYQHISQQVQELARETDPTHPVALRVAPIEDFYELKDKGGPLAKLNVRVFSIVDKARSAIVDLGAIAKQNDGKTPIEAREKIGYRRRGYINDNYR